MDGVYSNPRIKEIFNILDVYNNVEFVKPDEFFSVTTKNGTFTMPDDILKAQKKLIEKFPREQKGIEKYFKLIGSVSKELEVLQSASWYHYLLFPLLFSNILRYKAKTVTEVLDNIIENDDLTFAPKPKHILSDILQHSDDTH